MLELKTRFPTVFAAWDAGTAYDKEGRESVGSTVGRAMAAQVHALAGSPLAAQAALGTGERFARGPSGGIWNAETRGIAAQAAVIAGGPAQAREASDAASVREPANMGVEARAGAMAVAAVAGSAERAREAYRIGDLLDRAASPNGWNQDTRLLYAMAAAAAGDEDAARRAQALGRALDGDYSHEGSAVFTLMCAVAGTEEKARRALELAYAWIPKSQTSNDIHALAALAAVVAGTDSDAQDAFRLADHLSARWSFRAQVMAAMVAATAIAQTRDPANPPRIPLLVLAEKD